MNTHVSTHDSKFAIQFSSAVILAALLGVLALTGCRTMEGAGKDIENAGEAIQDKANK